MSRAAAPAPPPLPARDFDTLPDADVMMDADDNSSTPPSLPPALPPARRRTRARGSLLKLVGAAGVLMALAGTAFAMRAQADNDAFADAPSEVPSAPSAGASAHPAHELLGPSAEAHELKFQKDQKPASKHKPSAKSRNKAKATSPRHA